MYKRQVRLVHGIAEERRAVQIIVQQLGLGVVAGLHVGKAAHFSFDPFQHKAHHIDDVAGRRVVHALGVDERFVIQHGGPGDIRAGVFHQVFPDDGYSHARGRDIFLHAEVDQPVLGDVCGTAEDAAG